MSAHLFDALLRVDAALAKKGVHPMSAAWREAYHAFYLHPTAREMVAMVGRGGVKTGTAIKAAIVETLAGEHVVPPGEAHYFAHVSENVDEARKSLRIAESYLRMLGEHPQVTGDTVTIPRLKNRGIKVLANRVGAVSGFRCFGWTADEEAKWPGEGSVECAADVIASLRAMCVTHPRARGRKISTPLGMVGDFQESVERGTNDRQVVVRGPSWHWNDGITEAETRRIEPDERVWRREYAAIPQAGALGAFDPDAIARAIRPLSDLEITGRPIVLLDSSAGSGDAWTFCAAAWCAPLEADPSVAYLWVELDDPTYTRGAIMIRGDRPMRQAIDERGQPIVDPKHRASRPVLAFYGLGALEGRFAEHIDAEDAVARVARLAERVGASRIAGDQYQKFFLTGSFARRSLHYAEQTWTNESKTAAVLTVRRWLADGTIAIEPGAQAEKLKGELLNFQERIGPSGALTFGARRGGHDDRVALLLNAAMAEADGAIRGAPYARRGNRTELLDYTPGPND